MGPKSLAYRGEMLYYFIMNNIAAKKVYAVFTALCLLYGQSFGQVAFGSAEYKMKQYTAVQDNTRVVKPLLDAKLRSQTIFDVDTQIAADKILSLSATGLKTKQQQQAFDKTANDYIGKFYGIASGKIPAKKDLYHKVYSAVLPLIWFNANLKNKNYLSKISALYKNQYSACLSNLEKCDFDKTGSALLFINSYKPELINLSKISSVMVSEKTDENSKINFLQYAAPVMADRGGKVYFEDIINKLSKQNLPSQRVTEGYFDPFAFVKAFDNSYQWIKETCTHKDGFGGGVCAAFKGGKKPFRQYKSYPVPSTITNMRKKQAGGQVLQLAWISSKVKQPGQLSSVIRMYGEFYSYPASWYSSFKYLLNADLPSESLVTCHRDIALAEMAMKAPSSIADKGKIRLYMASRINNDYFALNQDKDLDQALKASLKNELGAMYAKLTGYKGASPVKVLSDEGFYSNIAYANNEKEIEGFWGSMFNFKDRPAEAVTNVFILGLITKGLVKNSNKIWAAAVNLFKNTEKLAVNMPSIIRRARVQYKALKYLANKNSMRTTEYVYKNAVYRSTAKTAVKGLNTVEGVASKEFFASSHYNAASHGNITRISKDVNKAVSAGLTDLGKGGAVPSFIKAEEYAGGFNAYTKDLVKQQEILQKQLAAKYKAKLPTKATAPQAEPALGSAAEAQYSLPRNYMYSADKSAGLRFAQNQGFAKEYNFNNTVYKGLKARGFNFFDTKTGAALGDNLAFHSEGFLQASGRVGLSYANGTAGGFAQAFKPMLNGVMQNVLMPVQQFATLAQGSRTFKNALSMFDADRQVSAFNNVLASAPKTFESYYNISLMSLNLFGNGSIINSGVSSFTPRNFLPDNANSTFKIIRPDGEMGTGFLLNYRGMPVVVSSGHVVRSFKSVKVQDINGNVARGEVLDATYGNGIDLAAIAVEPSFFMGKVPFELALRDPQQNEIVYAFSYPGGGDYKQSILRVYQTDFTTPKSKAHLYRTTADNLTYGSSGGPLTLTDIDTKVAGVAYALTYNEENALFMGLRSLRSFMTSLTRQIILDPVYRSRIMPMYPGFMKNYENVLSKYKPASILTPPTIKIPHQGKTGGELNLISVNKEEALEQLKNATFKVQRRSDNSGGSGFYINYRGLPMIVTAAHVVRDDKFVEIFDSEGILSFGSVFARSNITRGYDFAIVLPEKGFLEGKTPLKLGVKEPTENSTLFSAGFPKDKWTRIFELNLVNKNHIFDSALTPVYKAAPQTGHGTSGGPLVQLGNPSKVVGVTHMADEVNSFFVSLPQLRNFLKTTLRTKFLDADFAQDQFLKDYPALAKNYQNLISANLSQKGTRKFTGVNGPFQDRVDYITERILNDDLRFVSSDGGLHKYNNGKLAQATFMIKPLSGESFGSGFYVKHRGVPMIITAAHVLEGERVVNITDSEGETSLAAVLATTDVNRGYDVALLIPQQRILANKVPLTLSPKAPSVGESMLTLGFDMFENVIARPLTISSVSEVLESSLGPVYKSVPGIAAGMSGGPLVPLANTGRVSGFTHLGNSDAAYFMPLSTIKGFINKTFAQHLAAPEKSFLVQKYPEFKQNYANIIENKTLAKSEPRFNIGEGTKRFLFKTMTGLFGMKPKAAVEKLYGLGAKPRTVGYPIAGGAIYVVDDVKLMQPDLSLSVPEYPFSANRINRYRGMALSMDDLQNIHQNGIRLQDVGDHNNDFLVLTYPSAELAKYAKDMDCNKTICFTGDPKSAAHYSLKHFSDQKNIPVVVHVKDVALGTDINLSSSIVQIATEDVPASKIVNYSAMLKTPKGNEWGKITFDDKGRTLFTPYTTGNRTDGPSLSEPYSTVKTPSVKQLTTLPSFYNNFSSIFQTPVLRPALANQYNLPGIRNIVNGRGLFGEKFLSFDMSSYKAYYNGVKSSVVEIENPLLGKSGSGFYLRKGNMEALITAGHLVDGSSTVRVRSALGGDWYGGKVAAYSLGESNDIGLIEVANKDFWKGMKPLSLAETYPKEGAEIFSYGFPWGAGFDERAGIFKGFTRVSNGRIIVASEHTAPGSSGGPILYDGKVIGVCKKGICGAEIALNPAKMKSVEPSSFHTTWEEVSSFLNKAVLRTMPSGMQYLVQKNPFKYSSVLSVYKTLRMSDKRLLLNPRGYGFNTIVKFDSRSVGGDLLMGTDYGFNDIARNAAVGVMTNVLKMPTKQALSTLYNYGFKPYSSGMPLIESKGIVIDNLENHKPDFNKPVPPYPFVSNKKYIYRGMALNTPAVQNIDCNGLRLKDVGASNNLYLHALYPGAMRTLKPEDNRTICLTETPSDAAFYSMRDVPEDKPIPTVVNVKGIKQGNTMGFGILYNNDIPRAQVSSVNVLLSIDGQNVWGRAETQADGTIVFYPYKAK